MIRRGSLAHESTTGNDDFTTGTPVLDFGWCLPWISKLVWIHHLRAFSPACKWFLRSTSDVTTAALLTASIAAKPFIHILAQAWVGFELDFWHNGHGSTDACGCVWRLQVCGSKWLGCHAVYACTMCTSIGGKDRCCTRCDLRITTHKQEIHSGFETHEEVHIKFWNRGNQWLHKIDLGPTNFFKNFGTMCTLIDRTV